MKTSNPILWLKVWSFATVLSLFALAGCGGSSNSGPVQPTTGVFKLNGVEYKALDKGTLKSTDTSVEGSGSIIFKDPRADADNNYTLNFSLADKGSLTLATNSDAQLKAAVKMTFARDGRKLKVFLGVGDAKPDDLSAEFTGVAADQALNISVDVHGHGHAIVWVGDGEEQEYAFTGRVPGRLWGLVLKDATVTKAVVGDAKDEH